MLLFQFWDKKTAPDEVEDLMATWSREPGFEYERYDYESARDFIAENFDARTLQAYLACSLPAMQADFFRLCRLFPGGGVYVDADSNPIGRVVDLVNKGERGYLFTRGNVRVANDFMVFRQPRDPLVGYALATAIDNIEKRIFDNVWDVTGPGILTRLRNSDHPEKERLFSGIFIDDVANLRKIVLFKDLDYKRNGHWNGRTDIFRDPP